MTTRRRKAKADRPVFDAGRGGFRGIEDLFDDPRVVEREMYGSADEDDDDDADIEWLRTIARKGYVDDED